MRVRLLRLLRLLKMTGFRYEQKSAASSRGCLVPDTQAQSGPTTSEKQKAGFFDVACSIRRLTLIFTPRAKNILTPAGSPVRHWAGGLLRTVCVRLRAFVNLFFWNARAGERRGMKEWRPKKGPRNVALVPRESQAGILVPYLPVFIGVLGVLSTVS